MTEDDLRRARSITPDMTVLEVIDRFRETEAVFRKYDEQAGICICCQALFETIKDLSEKYAINLSQIINELETRISNLSPYDSIESQFSKGGESQ